MKKIKLFEEFISEKTITVDWNDDENSLIFSDAGIIKVDYDGEFKYRNKWFSTAEHTGSEDLIKDLSNAFKSDKFVYANESKVNEAVKVSVSLRYARDARELFDDMYKKFGSMDATDVFSFKDKDAAHDFVQSLVKHLNVPVGEIDAPKDILK